MTSRRIQEFLAEMLPIAHTLVAGEEKASNESSAALVEALQTLLLDEDREGFLGLLEALRAEGLTEVWEFCWDFALARACDKTDADGYRSVLLGLPLLSAWNGQCSGADRREMTKILREHGCVPKKAKVFWVAMPQRLSRIQDTDPITLWALNTPGLSAPNSWTNKQPFSPGVQILVGRVELPPNTQISWAKQEELRQLLAERLGWSVQSLGIVAPLSNLVEQEEDPDPEDQMLTELGLTVRHAVQRWMAESPRTEGCRILLESVAQAPWKSLPTPRVARRRACVESSTTHLISSPSRSSTVCGYF